MGVEAFAAAVEEARVCRRRSDDEDSGKVDAMVSDGLTM